MGPYQAAGNANCWRLRDCIGLDAARHNLAIHHEGGSDANAGVCDGGVFQNACADNVWHGSGAWNTIRDTLCQVHGRDSTREQAGVGVRLTDMARGFTWDGGDIEGDGIRGLIEANSFGHRLRGPAFNGDVWVDQSGYPERNLIEWYSEQLGRWVRSDEVVRVWTTVQRRPRSARAKS